MSPDDLHAFWLGFASQAAFSLAALAWRRHTSALRRRRRRLAP